jgi:hypothetical protein
MPNFGRIVLICSLAAALALAATQVAGANGDDSHPPSGTRSLAGEEFLVNDIATTIHCDGASVSSVVQFTASGPATGPYPGTFTAHGTAVIAPQSLPGARPGTVAGPLLALNETFSINSAQGTVRGHKMLQAGQPFDQSQGTCQHVTGFATGPVSAASGTVVELFSQPAYEATIQDSTGTYQVHGETSFNATELDLNGVCAGGPCPYRLASFDEFFLTSVPGGAENDDENDENNAEEDLERSGNY